MSERIRKTLEVTLVKLRQTLLSAENLQTVELNPLGYDTANIIGVVEERQFVVFPQPDLLGLTAFNPKKEFGAIAVLGPDERVEPLHSKTGCDIGLLRFRQKIGSQIEELGQPVVLNLTDEVAAQLPRKPVTASRTNQIDIFRMMNVYFFPNSMVADLAVRFGQIHSEGIYLNTTNMIHPQKLASMDQQVRQEVNGLYSLFLHVDYQTIARIFRNIGAAGGLVPYVKSLNDKLV